MDLDSPLISEDLRQLDRFMQIQGGMRVPQLHGYLTGIISARSLAVPKEWIFQLWEERFPLEASLKNLAESMDAIMRLYNMIMRQLDEKQAFFPLLSLEEEPYEQASINADALQQWCQEYLKGIHLDAQKNLPIDKYVTALYLPILILASDDKTVRQRFSAIFKDPHIAELRQWSRKILPDAIIKIYCHWRVQEDRAVN